MKKRQRLYVEEWPEDALPYLWTPERVPHCRNAACRRARRCVRPRMVEGRPPPRFPTCPLITDKEWAAWGLMVYREIEEFLSPAEAEVMLARLPRCTAPAGMVLSLSPRCR